MYQNRQLLAIFILSLYFYSIILFNESDINYIDGQICYDFHNRLAEFLLKIWQFCHLVVFATPLVYTLVAVLLPGLTNFLSKYWKYLDWCFLYSIYIYLVLLNICRFSNGMIFQWVCPTVHKKLAIIGCTISVKRIIGTVS